MAKIKNNQLELLNVAFTDVENVFTLKQIIDLPASTNALEYRIGGVKKGVINVSSGVMKLGVSSVTDTVDFIFNVDSKAFLASNNDYDLGASSFPWRYANVVGVKSVENSPTKVFASDGSVVDLLTKTIKVSLSASEINNLGTTPIEVIAAPGAGKYIKVLSGDYKLTWGSVAFDSNAIVIKTDGSNSYHAGISNQNVDATEDVFQTLTMPVESLSNLTQHIPNTKVVISGTDSVATGDSTIDVYITYQIITL